MGDLTNRPSARRQRRGAMALEYALVVCFVAVTMIAALLILGDSVSTSVGSVGDTVLTAKDAFK